MKIHLIVKDLGGGQPVINIHGTATHYAFSWNAPRAAHVRTYSLVTEEELKVFRREQADILNQKLMWPITIDVDVSEGQAPGEPSYAALKANFLELREALEVAREKVARLEGQQTPPVDPPAENPDTVPSQPEVSPLEAGESAAQEPPAPPETPSESAPEVAEVPENSDTSEPPRKKGGKKK